MSGVLGAFVVVVAVVVVVFVSDKLGLVGKELVDIEWMR